MMKILYFSIIITFVLTLGINGTAYGQHVQTSPLLTVWTDKPNYVTNDTVTIAGYVDKSETKYVHRLEVAISNPYGDWYKQDQFPVDPDGRFSYQFKIEGNHTISGHYLARVWSNDEDGIDVGTSFNVDSTINSPTVNILVKQGSVGLSYSGDNISETIEYSITVEPKFAGSLYVDIFKNNHLLRTDTLGTPDIISLSGSGGQYYYYKLTINGKKDQDTYKIDFRYGGKVLEKIIPITSTTNGIIDDTAVSIPTPIQQFKSGTAPKDIACRQDLLLIFKSSDEAPICIKPDNAKKLELRGWAISQYHDPGAKPKINLYDYSYDGIDKDNGIVSINNQTFYQTTLGYSVYDIPKKASTSFHGVVFAFPQGSLITPGSSFVMLDMKFHDGFEETYGGTALVQNGTVTKIGGIPIPTQYGPHVATNSITILGNHTMPQAGITIFHDKIKLLVSVDQLLTGDNVVNNTAQVIPQCLTHILKQTVFSGYAGALSCPIMGYHVSSEMENYTGFHEISDTLYPSSVVGPNTYVGTLQEELDKSGNERMEKNLVLEPGHNATITYKITLHTMKCNGECPDKFNFPTQANLTNDVELVHRENSEMSYSHEGLVVKYDPPFESLVDGQTITLQANISASKDVPRGTYWLILVPGNCVGGPLILLTVSDCEK